MDKVRAVCTWSGYNVAKSGTESIKLKFRVDEDRPELYLRPGATLYADLWLSEKSEDNTAKVLRGVFGWFGLDVDEFIDHHDMLNDVEVELVVEWEEYNGRRELKVKFVNPVGGIPDPVTQIDRATAKTRSDRMRVKLMAYDQQQQQKQAAAQAGTVPAKPTPASKPADRSTPKPVAPKSSSGTLDWKDVKPKQKPAPPPTEEQGQEQDDGDDLPF